MARVGGAVSSVPWVVPSVLTVPTVAELSVTGRREPVSSPDAEVVSGPRAAERGSRTSAPGNTVPRSPSVPSPGPVTGGAVESGRTRTGPLGLSRVSTAASRDGVPRPGVPVVCVPGVGVPVVGVPGAGVSVTGVTAGGPSTTARSPPARSSRRAASAGSSYGRGPSVTTTVSGSVCVASVSPLSGDGEPTDSGSVTWTCGSAWSTVSGEDVTTGPSRCSLPPVVRAPPDVWTGALFGAAVLVGAEAGGGVGVAAGGVGVGAGAGGVGAGAAFVGRSPGAVRVGSGTAAVSVSVCASEPVSVVGFGPVFASVVAFGPVLASVSVSGTWGCVVVGAEFCGEGPEPVVATGPEPVVPPGPVAEVPAGSCRTESEPRLSSVWRTWSVSRWTPVPCPSATTRRPGPFARLRWSASRISVSTVPG